MLQVDKMSEEERQLKLVSELKNGRLAMIGMASIYAAATIKGSVPALKDAFETVSGGMYGTIFPYWNP